MSPGLRKWLLLAHRWTGVVFAIVLVLVGITGTLLAFQFELRQWADGKLELDVEKSAAADIKAVVQTLEEAFPQASITFVRLNRAEPDFPARAVVKLPAGDYRRVLVDPYKGSLLSTDDANALWDGLRDLHVHLMVPVVGTLVVYASGWVLILTSAIGTWLWWPRLRRSWRALVVRRGASGRALVLDLHNTLGVYLLLPMCVIALTGSLLIQGRLEGWQQPDLARPAEIPPASESLVKSLAALEQVLPAGRIDQVIFPSLDSPWYGFQVSTARQGNGNAVVRLEPYELFSLEWSRDLSVWQRLKADLGVALHEGYIAGDFGQGIVMVCGLTLTFGAGSGVWLWWHRGGRTRKPARRAVRGAPASAR